MLRSAWWLCHLILIGQGFANIRVLSWLWVIHSQSFPLLVGIWVWLVIGHQWIHKISQRQINHAFRKESCPQNITWLFRASRDMVKLLYTSRAPKIDQHWMLKLNKTMSAEGVKWPGESARSKPGSISFNLPQKTIPIISDLVVKGFASKMRPQTSSTYHNFLVFHPRWTKNIQFFDKHRLT